MRVYGNLDLSNNQAQQLALELETEFPQTPVLGKVVFKDKRVWICIKIGGSPIWVPLGPMHDTYVHTQNTSSSMWEVEHNFNLMNPSALIYPIVQVYGGDGNQLIPEAIYYVDDSTINIDMGSSTIGKAVCMYGDTNYYEGLITPQYAYVYDQPVSQTTWVIRHWLGYTPIVRVFDDNGYEVQPASITVDDIFQVTVHFTVPVTGTARLI